MFLTTISLFGVLAAPVAVPAGKPRVVVDPCTTAAADAQATLGSDNDADVVQYYGTGYYDVSRTCRRYIADFSVPPNANPAGYLELNFSLHGAAAADSLPSDKSSCDALKVNTLFYKKASGQTKFTKIGTNEYVGKWTAYAPDPSQLFGPGGKCELVYKSGTSPTGAPNAAGTDVYRVAVRALSGGARAVQASIMFIMTPPH